MTCSAYEYTDKDVTATHLHQHSTRVEEESDVRRKRQRDARLALGDKLGSNDDADDAGQAVDQHIQPVS